MSVKEDKSINEKNLVSLSLAEMREGLLKGDFSAKELTTAHLERIKRQNKTLNSFLVIAEDSALESAKIADKVIKEQKQNSPVFTGIPVAIKDMLLTEGMETTCASKILKGFIPPYDCTAVSKLKKAGAVILGKTNMDEFAMGSSNETSAFGVVRNPYNQECVPGGSSGGSATAVAVGEAAISLGTDTGGSIRQPAALCGIVGLKPTYGRVSRYGAVAFASSLDQIGPFARNVEDVAITLEAISGEDEFDATSARISVPKYSQTFRQKDSLKGIRVGIPKEYFMTGLNEEVEASVRKGIEKLVSLGAEPVEISLPHTEYALAVYYVLAPAEASSNLARFDGIRFGHRTASASSIQELYEKSRAEGFGKEVKRRILIGAYVLSAGYYDAYYLKAQQVRTLVTNDFKAAFANHCDVIACPTSPTTAFKLGEKAQNPLSMYLADVFTLPTNLAGLPGLSMPSGLDSSGLPIGFQLIAKPFAEEQLLQVAYCLEQEIKFDTRKIISSTAL